MTRPLLVCLALLVPACGGSVTTPGAGGAGGTTSTTTPLGCAGSAPFCADECGSDYLPAQADCIGGEWICPPGTVNPDDCPPGTCWGAPLPCEVCGPSGWGCELTPACTSSCGGLVCAECPADGGGYYDGGCACQCDAAGQTSCALAPGCCQEDIDCGDLVYTPCVNNVCKEPVPGKCWSDAECLNGTVCVGASVCPCFVDCDGLDVPGDCVPPP